MAYEYQFPGGVTKEFEEPLTPEQLEYFTKLFASGGRPIPQQGFRPSDIKPAPNSWEYIKDRAKKGLGEAVELVGHIGSAVGGADIGDKPAISAARKKVEDSLGVQNYTPNNPLEQYAGAGVEMMADPTNWAFGKGIGGRVLSNFLPGAGAEAGADIARQAKLGPAAEMAAGIVMGAAGGLTNAGIDRTGRLVKNVSKMAGEKGLVDAANTHAFSLAEQHIKNTIAAALKADPKLAATIINMQAKAQRAGVELPIFALADNDVVKSSIRDLASRDAAFGAQMGTKYEDALAQLKGYSDSLFGAATEAKQTLQKSLGRTQAQKVDDIQARLDSQIQTASNPTGPFPSRPVAPYYADKNRSGQIKNLLTTEEGNISPRSQPHYQEADRLGKDQSFSPESTKEIWDTVVGDMKESPYQRFPSLYEKVRKVASPVQKTVQDAPEYFGGPAASQQSKEWKNTPYEEVRSLQREISNEYARLNPNSPSYRADRAALSELRGVVDRAVEKDFSKDVVDNLVAGGKQFAYDLNLRNFGRAAFNDNGILDPVKATAWLKDENNLKAAFKLIDPETGKTLGETVKTPAELVARLIERKDYVKSLATDMKRHQVLDIAQMTPDEIVKNMYSDDKFVSTFLKKHGNNKETLKALQSFMMDDIMNSGTPLKTLLEDKNKASTYNRVFGPGYTSQVELAAELAEKLKNNPAAAEFNVKYGVTKDAAEERFNIPASQIFSKLRNPIISKWQAIMELSSRALTGAADNAFQAKMKAIWLDPAALKEYVSALKAAETAPAAESTMKKIESFITKHGLGEIAATSKEIGRGAFIGAKQDEEGEE